jgi:hypothetical protein
VIKIHIRLKAFQNGSPLMAVISRFYAAPSYTAIIVPFLVGWLGVAKHFEAGARCVLLALLLCLSLSRLISNVCQNIWRNGELRASRTTAF